ncbi:hypothetical protein [Bacillus cihuensis]|uniref:hypothetical protein n=1 Tax=Bacillus cihuensis TaxID=1208599 RepID=UPI0004081208|nr:hypothetical protein [Bacillus cihuensis]
MGNPISKIVAFLIAILLIVWLPIYQSFEKQDSIAYHHAYQSVTTFVDNVRNKGYITPDMYEDFQSSLEIGSYLYDIEMTHEEKVYTPVHTDPAQSSTFTGDFLVQYDEYYESQILETLFPDTTEDKDSNVRIYYLHVGDRFKVNISNKVKTKSSMMREFFTFGKTGNEAILEIPYGGMVLNEDY